MAELNKIARPCPVKRGTALKINPGNVLLFRGLTHSTIAAEKLNGRVRNGNGCFLLAMVTGKSKVPDPASESETA
jgi:hypothetical protein